LIVGLLGLLILSAAALLNTAIPKENLQYQAKAIIHCSNNTFQSDAMLVTDPDNSLDLRCAVDVTPAVPGNYTPTPTTYEWTVTTGKIEAKESSGQWSHPLPGLQEVRVSGTLVYIAPQSSNLFARKETDIRIPFQTELKCLVPLRVDSIEDGKVNGFEVGKYPNPTNPDDLKNVDNPATVKAHADIYQPPKLFYPVTKETYRLRIFKNYTLGEFDLDPRFLPLTYPRYVVIHPNILRKIDLLETVVREKGVHLSKFKIFYGYRSPAYNLGSREEDGGKTLKSGFSAHMYGLAVDILIDEDDNLVMDDLDGDGITTIEDAKALLQYVNHLDRLLLEKGSDLVGGAGWYPHHDFWERGEHIQSPYVHIDARGYTHGDQLVRWIGKDTIGIRKDRDPYRLKSPIPPWPW